MRKRYKIKLEKLEQNELKESEYNLNRYNRTDVRTHKSQRSEHTSQKIRKCVSRRLRELLC